MLYVRGSVDEGIYDREDWAHLVGSDRNRYFNWDPPSVPIEQDDPPRIALPREADIDLGTLGIGDPYPGRYEGMEYSTDSSGNVLDADGQFMGNPQGIPAIVVNLKGRPGRFRVTPNKFAVLLRVQRGPDEWTTLFGGIIPNPFEIQPDTVASTEVEVADLNVGDAYTGPLDPAVEYRFRQRSGGILAKKVRGGEFFAHGLNADALVEKLKEIRRTESPVAKLYVNDLGHAFWRESGIARFICDIDGSLEFPAAATP